MSSPSWIENHFARLWETLTIYDIGREIRWLGRQKQICEFHMKENGALLGRGRVDFKKVRAAKGRDEATRIEEDRG